MSSGFANNKDADQPAHSRSLVSAFVIRVLESVSKRASRDISILKLGSVAEETGFSPVLPETPKTGFLGPYVTIHDTINEMTCATKVESYQFWNGPQESSLSIWGNHEANNNL